eukprot:COSAG02_NODE_28090_length_596_cov_1.404427_1_plen_95_part_01
MGSHSGRPAEEGGGGGGGGEEQGEEEEEEEGEARMLSKFSISAGSALKRPAVRERLRGCWVGLWWTLWWAGRVVVAAWGRRRRRPACSVAACRSS